MNAAPLTGWRSSSFPRWEQRVGSAQPPARPFPELSRLEPSALGSLGSCCSHILVSLRSAGRILLTLWLRLLAAGIAFPQLLAAEMFPCLLSLTSPARAGLESLWKG